MTLLAAGITLLLVAVLYDYEASCLCCRYGIFGFSVYSIGINSPIAVNHHGFVIGLCSSMLYGIRFYYQSTENIFL